MSHIQIRYNTKSIDEKLPWRVIVDGQESLAQNIEIIGTAYGEKSYVDGVAKYNLAVDGQVSWDGDSVIIVSKERR